MNKLFKHKSVKIIAVIAAVAVLIGTVSAVLVWNGVILLNNPSKADYPIRGVDVSHYQGEIDWQTLCSEDIDFAVIKATEGSSHVDKRYKANLENALEEDIAVGCYHFFSFESGGDTQAEHFIKQVPKQEGMLPPTVDLELYGKYVDSPPSADTVKPELQKMLESLELYYGRKPIIYVTEESYDLYIAEDFKGYPIWIRDVVFKPTLSDGREWTFWQYTNRERLSGYSGEERFIDMNVFYGAKPEFEKFLKVNNK